MSETKLLLGSLSNDLFRVATLTERGSSTAAIRFLQEAKRWSTSLKDHKNPQYIQNIVEEINSTSTEKITLTQAEHYLMYSILLQNYTLHLDQSNTG